jgi:hypothetical protein
LTHTGTKPVTKPTLSTHVGTVLLCTHTDDNKTVVRVRRGTQGDGEIVAIIPVEDVEPDLGLPANSATRIVALDVLEHVLDEEAWLAAMSITLAPGGTVVVRVPLEGPFTWLDSLNMYRYVQDIIGFGKDLEETKMKGWHRHYQRGELKQMLEDAGTPVSTVVTSGSPHLDLLQFGALVWGGMVRRDSGIEHTVRAWRDGIEAGHDLPRLGSLSTKITLTGTKAATSPNGTAES